MLGPVRELKEPDLYSRKTIGAQSNLHYFLRDVSLDKLKQAKYTTIFVAVR